MKKKDDLSSIKDYAKFSGYAIQMGATIFAGAYLGKWLDGQYPADKKWFTMLLTIASVSLSLFILLRQINKHNEQQEK